METTLEIHTEKRGPALVLKPVGRLDNNTAPRFQTKAEQVMALGESKLVVDMIALDYISSAGMRSLLATAMQLRSIEGSSIVFARPGDMVMEVLRVTGFEKMFSVYSTLDEALKA